MKKRKSNNIYGQFSSLFIAALTCQAKLGVTLMVYTVIALLLLAYVSFQVFTGAVSQEISALKHDKQLRTEILNRISSDYISLSSRARVTQYCEGVLGMVQATDGSLERIAVSEDIDSFREPVQFTRGFARVPDGPGFTLLRDEGKLSQ